MEVVFRHQMRAAVGGALSGLAGGLAMIAVWVAYPAAHDVWTYLKLGAAVYLGPGAVSPGFALGPVAVGVSVHLYVALGWGFAFGAFTYGMSRFATLLWGLGLGVVCFVVMRLGLASLVGLGHFHGLDLPLHLWFGFITATAFLAFQRPLELDELNELRARARRLQTRPR